jgi:hypothetical protein
MIRLVKYKTIDINAPPMTAAIIPAKVPKKSTVSSNEDEISTKKSNAKTFFISNLNKRKSMASAEKTPARTKNAIVTS